MPKNYAPLRSWISSKSLIAPRWLWVHCFPSSFRLWMYRHLEIHYGVPTGPFGVIRLPLGLVLKFTIRPPHYEANNIRFITRNTSIPVPIVYDVISYPGPRDVRNPHGPVPSYGVILMSFIDGETLSAWLEGRTEWSQEFHDQIVKLLAAQSRGEVNQCRKVLDTIEPSLQLSDAQPLLNDLRNAIHELRNLPPPPSGAISGLNDSPLVWRHMSSAEVIPPFKDIDAFHEMPFSRIPHNHNRLPRLRRLARPVHMKQHGICFTHADLHLGNVLVKDGRLAAIIDWESAGWYPEYWECIRIQTQALRHKPALAFWDAVGAFSDGEYKDERILDATLLGTDAVSTDDEAPDPVDLEEEL